MADIVGKSKIYGSREEAINSLYNETQAQYSSGGYSWHPRYDGNHRFCRYYDEDGKVRTIFAIEHAPEGVYQGGAESMEVFADCEVYTFAHGTSAVTSCSSSEIIEGIRWKRWRQRLLNLRPGLKIAAAMRVQII